MKCENQLLKILPWEVKRKKRKLKPNIRREKKIINISSEMKQIVKRQKVNKMSKAKRCFWGQINKVTTLGGLGKNPQTDNMSDDRQRSTEPNTLESVRTYREQAFPKITTS